MTDSNPKILNDQALQKALRQNRIEWRNHTLSRLLQRNIRQSAVLEVLRLGERVRDYPEDRPYPSALFLGWHEGIPLHVVAAVDECNEMVYIITAYQPSLDYFEADYKTRKTQ